jgi:hypothetical protein
MDDTLAMYEEIGVEDWLWTAEEQIGDKPKSWLEAPDGRRWLYKRVLTRTRPDGLQYTAGEDWAEKVCAEIARELGIPAATVELARNDATLGVVSLDFTVETRFALVLGNEVLAGTAPNYPVDATRIVPEYSAGLVFTALDAIRPPTGWQQLNDFDAVDVFAGYLAFDAIVANTDRHHRNWGVLVELEGEGLELAPSFDHASSLGFQLSEQQRASLLASSAGSPSVASWAARGKAQFGDRPLLTEVAVLGLEVASSEARTYWVSQIDALTDQACARITERVPDSRMPASAKEFAVRVVSANRDRLLTSIGRLA